MTTRGPIRVLHLRDSPWVDGPGRTILETAARIDRSRVDYVMAPLVPDDGAAHPLVVAARERGVPVQPILDTGSLATLVERVTGIVDRLGIEILHSSEFRTNLVALRCRAGRPELKLVSTAHGWIANEARGKGKTFLDRILLRRFDRVILVSHAMRRRLPRWWIPDARVRVIHNALMTESYGTIADHADRQPPALGEPVRILAVGRLAREKRFDILLEAIARLNYEHPQLRLVIAGNGPLESALRKMVADLVLGEKVSFIGYVHDMAQLYASSDLVVQSSTTEGLPNVMLEAAFLGVPVVATDVGGTREVIEHGVGGWLVAPRSVNALASGIKNYLRQPAKFLERSRAGRARIAQHFSFTARTEQQMAVYEELRRDRT